jgi:hypothetical protein
MGCENWAMLLIMDIAVLDEWKKSVQASGKLSMSQLVSRGVQIEKRLGDGLDKNSGTIGGFREHSITSNANHLGYDSKYTSCVITRIFACSALVYLHVVVSGAFPELPEIRASVSRTIAAFQMLPDQGLVRSLTWPFCIAGCMALPEQEDFFRDIVSTTRKVIPVFGNSGKALAVMEECGRMRKSHGHEIGPAYWGTAMRSLGFNILLV